MAASLRRSPPPGGLCRKPGANGFTLIELLVSLVIFAAVIGGLASAFVTAGSRSADPMVQAQALAIAQAYLDEILLKQYADPDGVGGETRSNYDDLLDYDGLSEAPTDQFGVAVGELSAYTVTVSVGASALAAGMRRIEVRVSHPTGIDLALAAHRANL